jgi:hypothetical protein
MPAIFSNYSFLVLHPVYKKDQHLLAHAMASDFTVGWPISQREHFFTDQILCPHPTRSLPTQFLKPAQGIE